VFPAEADQQVSSSDDLNLAQRPFLCKSPHSVVQNASIIERVSVSETS
jgi:hypothetical protein